MKAEFTKYGPKHDYRTAHVSLKHGDRVYLGTIREVYRNEILGCTVCKVQHFCGDWWPFEPGLGALEILERTYEAS